MTTTPRTPVIPLEERFWSKVNKSGPIPGHVPEVGPCWIWAGARNAKGYGRLLRERKWVGAHRISYELHYGLIPDGLWVLHHCDTPCCVRPEHLFLGDSADNIADAASKKRLSAPRPWFHGENSCNAKLSAADVDSIRARYRAGGVRQIDIAREYGVAQTTISAIVRGVRWASSYEGIKR